MAAIAYSVCTGAYTVDQLEGEHCARCGQWFGLCPWPRPVEHERVDGCQLYRHVDCATAGAK